MTAQVWDKQSVVALLERNDKAVCRGVLAIYKKQTQDEKIVGDTHECNGVGFNGPDGKFMSYCAEYMLKTKCDLSGKFLAKARKKIIKYSGQLVMIINEGQVA